MREGWTYKKLGEVASYINGYAFKPEQWKESGTPIIRIQNLNNPEAPYNYYDGEVPEKVKIQNGDLLISWSASLGAYIWDGGVAFLNQHIFKVEFDKTDIDKMYLKYAVTSKLEAMANLVHGATMKHIVKKDFDNTIIPYPSKSQQEAIVSELDEINSLLALKREQLQKYDKLAQSLFYEMFGDPVENEKGWEVKKIGEVCAPKNAVLRASKKYGFGDTIQYIDISSIDNSIQKMMGTSICKYSEAPSRAQQVVQKDDILVSLVRPNLKNVAKIDIDDINLVASSGFCVLRASNIIATEYLFMYSISDCFTNYLVSLTSGANYPAVREQDIKEAIIPLPPLSLQQQFASRIEQIESQKQQVQAAIEKLETLLASRMQYWFD